MPANLENSAWPQDWKRSVFIPIPKWGNAKECSNYCTIVLISHASKVMLKILQARLQQYVNHERPDVQAGFRKGRGTRDQIAKIHWIIKKARVPEKYLLLLYWLCQSLWHVEITLPLWNLQPSISSHLRPHLEGGSGGSLMEEEKERAWVLVGVYGYKPKTHSDSLWLSPGLAFLLMGGASVVYLVICWSRWKTYVNHLSPISTHRLISNNRWLVSWWGVSGEGNSNPLQYSCLENPMHRGTCRATVRGVTKSRTLSN